MTSTRTLSIACCTFVLATTGATARAGDAPGTPPPATGVVTPLTGNRDDSSSHASASVPTEIQCAGQREISTTVSGAGTDRAMVNGAMVPQGTAHGGADWCGGAYSRDAGTNFAGR